MDDYGSGRPSVKKTTRKLLEEDGWRGFYRGFGPRFLNMSLWGTSMIVTYELISMLFFSLFAFNIFSLLFIIIAPLNVLKCSSIFFQSGYQ
jgi:Mitochondrial carrier protein